MLTTELTATMSSLFSELANGAAEGGAAFILNSGDAGFLKSIDRLTAGDASRSVEGGATIAAHVEHVRYGLALMNRWAREGGNPFADAAWDAAWRISVVNDDTWKEIRAGVGHEASTWLAVLNTPREVAPVELTGLVASIAHLAYHMGAVRQIGRQARGPRDGTFK